MSDTGMEKRNCVRFKIPGATVSYKTGNVLPSDEIFDEEFCPVLDISRGGILFVCQNKLEPETKLHMKISIPGERTPLQFKGTIRRVLPNPGKSYKYQTGIQFFPYGEKKDQNYLGNLVKIISLEQKFASDDKSPGGDDSDPCDFEVDG